MVKTKFWNILTAQIKISQHHFLITGIGRDKPESLFCYRYRLSSSSSRQRIPLHHRDASENVQRKGLRTESPWRWSRTNTHRISFRFTRWSTRSGSQTEPSNTEFRNTGSGTLAHQQFSNKKFISRIESSSNTSFVLAKIDLYIREYRVRCTFQGRIFQIYRTRHFVIGTFSRMKSLISIEWQGATEKQTREITTFLSITLVSVDVFSDRKKFPKERFKGQLKKKQYH